MKDHIKECVFIKNSLNQSFVLYIDNKQDLIFNELDTNNNIINSTKIQNHVLEFSSSICKNDKIHLVSLIDNGDLIYSIRSNELWHKNLIIKLNTKSNIYKHLKIFLHEDYINIFFAFTNLTNTNLWTIEQIIRNSNNWRKKVVTSIFSEKNLSPFYIDKDNFGNISLVYNAKEYDSNHIYYSFYNIFTEKWLPNPIKISNSTVNNILPYLFIDSKNNIHALWYSLNNNEYLLTYKRFSAVGKNKYQWVKVNLPKIINSDLPSVIFEENNALKILYISDNKINSISSPNFGEEWRLENSSPLNISPNYLAKYSSNFTLNNISQKFNHYYININNEHIHFYLNDYHNRRYLNKKSETTSIQETNLKTNALINNSNSLEHNSLLINQIMNTVNNIERELILVKEKIIDIEKTQKEKKGLPWRK